MKVGMGYLETEHYRTECRRVYRALRYGPLAVQLTVGEGRIQRVVLIPVGGVADHEDLEHNSEGLYVIITSLGVGMYLEEPAVACATRMSECMRVKPSDVSRVARFLRDVVRFAEEG